MLRIRSVWIGAVVVLATVRPVTGQVIAGTLADDDTQEGIAGATVALMSTLFEPLHTAVTDSLGRFVLRAPSLGAYLIRATHVRYGEVDTPFFNLTDPDTTLVTFFLSERAIVLDPLVVGVRAVTGSELFAQRRARGRGIFITPEMLDSLRPTRHVAEIFDHYRDHLYMTWTWGKREDGRWGPIPRLRSFRGRTGCLDYIVDRTPVPDPSFVGVENAWGVAPLSDLEPDDVVAIEIYRGWWEVPDDYEQQILANTLGTRRKLRDMRKGRCGVVILWTERGWGVERPTPPPPTRRDSARTWRSSR